jgi:vitamin B12 transporter
MMMQKLSRTRLRAGVALAALSAALCQTAPALAEDAEDLGKVVVSANRIATPISEVGSSVTVVTSEEIEKAQAKTLLDIIENTPGINVMSYGGQGKTSEFYMRGMPSKNVVLLIDGIDMKFPMWSMMPSNISTFLGDDVERVEILRGNQSSLYGANAVAGVIDVTTKTGKNSSSPFGGTAGFEAGSYNTYRETGNLYGRTGKVYYGASVSNLTSDGVDVTKNIDAKEADFTKNLTFGAKIGSDLVENVGILDLLNVEGVVKTIDSSSGGDTSSPVTDSDTRNESRVRIGKFDVNANLWNGRLKNRVSVSELNQHDRYYVNEARNNTNGVYDATRDKYEYQGTLKLADNHSLVFGADHARESGYYSYKQSAAGKGTSKSSNDNDGLFANYMMQFLEKSLTLNFGVRQDDNERFGDETTYRTTASYLIPGDTGTRLHSSYGTGFNAPSMFMLYGVKYGNPDLKPEESRGYDFGVEQRLLKDRIVLDSTFFKNNINNEISTHASTATPSGTQYYNVASSRNFGVENSMMAEITSELRSTVSYTYLQPRDNTNGSSMTSRPHHTGSLRLDYSPDEVPDLNTWVKISAVSHNKFAYTPSTASKPNENGGYGIVNLGADYKIVEGVKVYGRVENLLDKNYNQYTYYGTPGLSGYVGVKASF